MILSLMSQEEMTAKLEEMIPTEAAMLRNEDGKPCVGRGVLAMLLLLANRVMLLEEQVGDL